MTMKDEQSRAVGYARVSSKDQEDTGYSLPAQEKLLREYAERGGLNLVKVFAIQESASGRVQRKIFHEMLDHIKKEKIRVAIVETTDRLTRNFSEAIEIDKWVVEDYDRQIHLVKENCILQKDSRSHEWFMWRVKVATAEYYIRLLSENVKKGQKEKLAQGWLPAKPPLGYKTVGEKGRKIHVPDEETSPLVIKLFELYASGQYSVKTITEKMYELGMRSRSGRKVYKAHIHRLLCEPFYYGMNNWRNQLTQGNHQPIITKELFNKVQTILRNLSAPKHRRHNPLFRGVFRCKECDCQITWETHKGHWYGHCNHYRNCTQKGNIREDLIDDQVLNAIFGITIFRDDDKVVNLLSWTQEALKEMHAEEINYRDKATGELQKSLEMVVKRLDHLYDDKIDGKISTEFYQKKFEQYQKEQQDIQNSIDSHLNANLKYYEMGITVIEVVKHAKAIYERMGPNKLEDKRMMLALIFENLKIENGEFMPTYRKPYQMIVSHLGAFQAKIEPKIKTIEPPKKPMNKRESSGFAAACPTWLRGWDSNPRPMD